jgi:hypothetical protein
MKNPGRSFLITMGVSTGNKLTLFHAYLLPTDTLFFKAYTETGPVPVTLHTIGCQVKEIIF